MINNLESYKKFQNKKRVVSSLKKTFLALIYSKINFHQIIQDIIITDEIEFCL
jgi:hypothetical protein